MSSTLCLKETCRGAHLLGIYMDGWMDVSSQKEWQDIARRSPSMDSRCHTPDAASRGNERHHV